MKTTSDVREFIRYTVPNVLGMAGLSCYILADTFFISKGMGSNGLTALNLALPVYNFMHGTGLMLGIGGATRYSILRSQGHQKDAQMVYTHMLLLAGGFALLFFLLGLFGSHAITCLLGADEAVYDMTHTYLRVLLLFSPLFMLNDITLPFIRNDGAPRLAMGALITSSLSNIVLDYIFIFPLQMGIFGAVFATSIAPAISLAVFLPFFLKRKHSFHPIRCPFQLRTASSMMTLGLPSLVTEVSAGVVMIVFNTILLNLCGNLAVAAYGVVSNIAIVVTSIYTGIAQGAQPLFSRSYGSGQHERATQFLNYALGTALGLSLLVYALVFLGAAPIAAVFNSERDLQLQTMAVEGLKLYFTSCFFAGFNIVLSSYFASVARSAPANAISLLRGFFVVIPAAIVLSLLGGLPGLWCAMTITEVLISLFGIFVLRKKGKKYPV